MKNFLRKFGEAVLKGLGIIKDLEPTLERYVPGSKDVVQVVSKDLTEIAKVVLAAEVAVGVGGMTMDQILQMEAAQITQILLSSSLLSGKKIEDEEGLRAGAADIANGMVKVLKSVHADELRVVGVDKAA